MKGSGAVRLVIDASRCDGHAICVLRCPERISLDEWGYAEVDPTPTEGRDGARRARRAVRACPAGALSVVPAGESSRSPGIAAQSSDGPTL